MATIRKHRDKWQVRIRRAGLRPMSKSFAVRRDAMEWGRQMEVRADRAELPTDPKALERVTLGDLVRRYRDTVSPRKKTAATETIVLNASRSSSSFDRSALDLASFSTRSCRSRSYASCFAVMGARALEFAILTAARSGEVRGATWTEVDLKAAVWVVPGNRMKMGREHRVPLSPPVMALLNALPRMAGTDLLFPAPRRGALSDMTLSAVVRRMNVAAVPHGFRSTFRDWASERTNYPRDVAEMALAHAIGDKVEAAYRRGDLFEKRRRLMADWATFCGWAQSKDGVVSIRRETGSR
jgi:integrase